MESPYPVLAMNQSVAIHAGAIACGGKTPIDRWLELG
jgi:hypothetical protein